MKGLVVIARTARSWRRKGAGKIASGRPGAQKTSAPFPGGYGAERTGVVELPPGYLPAYPTNPYWGRGAAGVAVKLPGGVTRAPTGIGG